MATRFLDKATHRFYFENEAGERKSFKLIYGDGIVEVDQTDNPPPSGDGWLSVKFRGRIGEMKTPKLRDERSLEMYFLDVGQGDAAFIVTPKNKKILVDGGLKDRALGFLIWKYRLDRPGSKVTIDHMFLSHADNDHVSGLIPILTHPQIKVKKIHHNGIGSFKSGVNKPLGRVTGDKIRTLHDTTDDLAGLPLADGFGKWIDAVNNSGATYGALDSSKGVFNVGDPAVKLEILGPRREDNGTTLKWFSDKAHTINGHSLVFRLIHDEVRTFFSGDLNIKGSKHLLAPTDADLGFDAHIFKTPHHGSHEFHQPMFDAINPMFSVVSSGDSPDHGHPRASFLGGLGLAGRGDDPIVFSTEIAATFSDAGDSAAVDPEDPTTLGDLDFAKSNINTIARRRFKKVLPGIINIRSNGKKIYGARRVTASYQWEAYGPITPID